VRRITLKPIQVMRKRRLSGASWRGEVNEDGTVDLYANGRLVGQELGPDQAAAVAARLDPKATTVITPEGSIRVRTAPRRG
jgi:hypothetical protein